MLGLPSGGNRLYQSPYLDQKSQVARNMAFIASFSSTIGKSHMPFHFRSRIRQTVKLSTSSFCGNSGNTFAPLERGSTSRSVPVMLETRPKSKGSGKFSKPPKPTPPPPEVPSRATVIGTRSLMGVVFVGFVSYALFLGPGSLTDSKELKNIITMNFEDVNVVVFAIFCLLGAIPMNYAVALNPGVSNEQKIPFVPSVLSSFFAGFAGIGPYVITRKYVPSITKQEVESRGTVGRILESRWTSVGTAIFSMYSYVRCLGFFGNANEALRDAMFYSSFIDFLRLIKVDRFASVATVDFILLSVFLWGPLTEDMRRRGWFYKGGQLESVATALSILAVPGFGAALYFVLRPPLPDQVNSESEK